MEPFDAYKTYIALKLHFTSNTYDYFKYAGKVPATYDSFTKRKDRYQFSKLAKKDGELVDFIVSNFISERPPKWAGDLLDDRANKNYKEWQKRQQSFTYIFQNDLECIPDLRKAVKVVDHQHPELLKLLLQNEVSPETLIIINKLSPIFKMWDENIHDSIVWPTQRLRLQKYTEFIKPDVKKYSTIMFNKYARKND